MSVLMTLLLLPAVLSAGGDPVVSMLLVDSGHTRAIVAEFYTGKEAPSIHPLSLHKDDLDPDGIFAGGNGEFWHVGSICTRLIIIKAGSGRVSRFDLKEYEFEHGAFFPTGALVVEPGRLLVTHTQGAFLLDERGRTLAKIAPEQRPPIYTASRAGFEPFKHDELTLDNVWEVPPVGWLVPFGQQGDLIGAIEPESNTAYFELLDTNLVRKAAFNFPGCTLVGAAPTGNGAWLILGRKEDGDNLWAAVVDENGGRRAPQATCAKLPHVQRSNPLSVVTTSTRIWAAFPNTPDNNEMVLAAWDPSGEYKGMVRLPHRGELVGAKGESLFLIEEIGGRLKLVERSSANLDVTRWWKYPRATGTSRLSRSSDSRPRPPR